MLCILLARSDQVELVSSNVSYGDAEMHIAARRQPSHKPGLKPEQTWIVTVTSDQRFCRQRGAEIALEQVTPPEHAPGTRGCGSLGVAVKLSAQSKLLYRGSEPAD